MNFRWDLNQKIDATEQSIRGAIEKAVEMKKKSTVEVEAFKFKVEEQLSKLRKIKEDLDGLEEAIEGL